MSVNYSLYAVPGTLVLAYVPHLLKSSIVLKATGTLDNVNPRKQLEAARGRMTASSYDRAKRAEAAHANGMETFPVYAAALILGNLAHLPVDTLNTYAAIFLGTRFLYNFVYVMNTTRPVAALRSLLWGAGVGSAISLMFQAASATGGLKLF
ncbi:hypothetical protein HKX48_003685 [Thoreauomyces humboldtii]|nr:hypothetical protein HKX48_003685 [Thoreauomyces humboldtii]